MKTTFMAGIALLALGCASHPKPTEQVATSMAAVRGAEEAGARDVPEAALHLKLAEEQIERAKNLMEDDDNAEAAELASRAFQDAELALALARESASKRQLEEFAQGGTAGGESMQQAPSGTQSPMQTQPQGTATP